MEETMSPYRTSTSARIVSGAVVFALIGVGLIPTLGLNAPVALSAVLMISITATIIGLLQGAQEHTGAVAAVAIAAPLAMFPYVLLSLLVLKLAPHWALAFVAAGVLVLATMVLATVTVRKRAAQASGVANTVHG
jgi:hypothetical protein